MENIWMRLLSALLEMRFCSCICNMRVRRLCTKAALRVMLPEFLRRRKMAKVIDIDRTNAVWKITVVGAGAPFTFDPSKVSNAPIVTGKQIGRAHV